MPEKKTLYIAFAAALLAAVAVPSAVFVDACGAYFSFLSQWSGGAQVSFSPQQKNRPRAAEIKFVRFTLKKKGVKSVFVRGDFNGWDGGSDPMKQEKPGEWAALAAVPAGASRYEFIVAGAPLRDPAAHGRAVFEGREVSVLK
ncbi:MAG: hypothetical protein WC421_00395 [Elusimicrobiales bacterium]